MLRISLFINLIFCVLVGLLYIFRTDIILLEDSPVINSLGRTIGLSYFAMAACSISLLFYHHSRGAIITGYGTLVIFHAGQLITRFINYAEGLSNPTLLLFHCLISVFLLAIFTMVFRRLF